MISPAEVMCWNENLYDVGCLWEVVNLSCFWAAWHISGQYRSKEKSWLLRPESQKSHKSRPELAMNKDFLSFLLVCTIRCIDIYQRSENLIQRSTHFMCHQCIMDLYHCYSSSCLCSMIGYCQNDSGKLRDDALNTS